MKPNELEAFKTHRKAMIKALAPQCTTETLLTNAVTEKIIKSSERQTIAVGNTQDQVVRFLETLEHKDRAWSFMIKFLNGAEMKWLAVKMEKTANAALQDISRVQHNPDANETSSHVAPRPQRCSLRKFMRGLTKFYMGDYRNIQTFNGNDKMIDEVWVDLKLSNNTKGTISDYNEIFSGEKRENSITLISGQPGMGKTALVKKIAYDWAVLYEDNKLKTDKQPMIAKYDYILAAPMRDDKLQAWMDPLEMAVSFHLQKDGEIKGLSEALKRGRNRTKPKILVILDGLDEYRGDIRTHPFFSKIFPKETSVDRIDLKYDLLITSRPYASEKNNENVSVTQWKISGVKNKDEFIDIYFKHLGEEENKRVTTTVKSTLDNPALSEEINENPLLLAFVCFLAEQNPKVVISGKLTSLYKDFVEQMLKKSKKKGRITCNLTNWQESELVQRLGRLALFGVLNKTFELNTEDIKMYKEELKEELKEEFQEELNSALLLYRSDTVSVGFSHRSIQEFLAALHCVHYMATNSPSASTTEYRAEQLPPARKRQKLLDQESPHTKEKIWPIDGISKQKVELLTARMIRFGNSQFCRFYFGLLSGRELEVKENMRKLLEIYFNKFFISSLFLFSLKNSLADCTDEECIEVGKMVNSLMERKPNSVPVKREEIFLMGEVKKMTKQWDPQPGHCKIRDALRLGLQLEWLKHCAYSFYLGGKAQILRIRFFDLEIWQADEKKKRQEAIQKQLQEKKIVNWIYLISTNDITLERLKWAAEMLSLLLPNCRNCVIMDESEEYFPIRLWLKRKSAKKGRKSKVPVPQFIYFQVERSLGEEIFHKFASLEKIPDPPVKFIKPIKENSNGGKLKLEINNSNWTVWDFLKSEADLNG